MRNHAKPCDVRYLRFMVPPRLVLTSCDIMAEYPRLGCLVGLKMSRTVDSTSTSNGLKTNESCRTWVAFARTCCVSPPPTPQTTACRTALDQSHTHGSRTSNIHASASKHTTAVSKFTCFLFVQAATARSSTRTDHPSLRRKKPTHAGTPPGQLGT